MECPFSFSKRVKSITLLLGIFVSMIPGYTIGFVCLKVAPIPHSYHFFQYKHSPFLKISFIRHENIQSLKDAMDNGEGEQESNDNNSNQQQTGHAFYQDEDCFDLCETPDDVIIQDIIEPSSHDKATSSYSSTSTTSSTIYTAINPMSTTTTIQRPEGQSIITNNMISPTQMMKNIELRWSIEESNVDCDVEDISSCSEPCLQCHGLGTAECTFCFGSGYIDVGVQESGTMGDQLVRQNGGRTGIECPVCNENGDQVCNKCMGSGYIARWRINLPDLRSHP